jgi:ketosteroid isomerase-like protein
MSKLLIICWIGFLCCAAIGCGRGRSGDAMEAIAGRERAIELLQKAYDAFNRGDMAGAVAGLDPQIEWTEPDSFPGGGTHHGTAEVQGYLTRSRAGWAEGRSEPERFIAAGDRIVVFVHARFRGKGSAEWGEVRLADVYTFRDGRPVQMRAFADREEALRWAGVKDPKLGM